MDEVPTVGSENLVKSGGVGYDYESLKNRAIEVNETISSQKDYPILLRTGDIFKCNCVPGTSTQIKCFLMRTITPQSFVEIDKVSETVIAEDDFTYFRVYYKSGTASTQVNFSITPKEINDIQSEIDTVSDYVNMPKTIELEDIAAGTADILQDVSISPQNGDILNYSVTMTNPFSWRLYLIRTLSPLSFELFDSGTANKSGQYLITEDTFTVLRFYKVSASSQDSDASVSYQFKTPEILPSDVSMCLPNKIFAVKGLPYNIYKNSIMPKSGVDVNMFTYPMTESNFEADLINIGQVSHLKSLKDCSLRIGLLYEEGSFLIHKDLPVVWNDVSSSITKKINIIGDSLTNRGIGYFTNLAAVSVNCTINQFGTLNNYENIKGEGREGWTVANFIGKQNTRGTHTITPQLDGEAGQYKNPFLREATATDKQNNPQYCFPSTGAASEASYADNPNQGTYYIFDYQYYLNRWSAENIPDVVIIALGTNDILQNYAAADIATYAVWMCSQIHSVVQNAKVGFIPSPAWGLSYDFANKVVPYIEAVKTAFSSLSYIDVIGMWCFMDRALAFGLDTSQNVVINASTDKTPYADYVHFDAGDGGHKAYMDYGKVVASYILCQ